ncbi:hypothetical protein [Couchioplanes caeruleus]|uniref:Uncharacterized protein n=1 Tax=Couchioplanes caeruleus TaxID=56438 RepID=A0A3N1GMF6_9ACTN|nr:hypothetical protein [Couchioplanes caeruleus]ROP31434.1 hypothetical protein EDD30_4335 [Couchioplanes caeruleus]
MVSQTSHTVTTRLTCGCIVASQPGVYATCPRGHAADRPSQFDRSRRKG